jgi:hypothetical protein
MQGDDLDTVFLDSPGVWSSLEGPFADDVPS